MDIEACNDIPPYNIGYNVGWTEDNEWMLYTVDILNTEVYDLSIRCANGTTAAGFLHIEMDNVDVSGIIAIPPTGGWQSWKDFAINGIPLSVGKNKMKVVFDKAGFNINAVKWSISTSPVLLRLMSTKAMNDSTIQILYNKPFSTAYAPNSSDFSINSSAIHSIQKVVFDSTNPNALLIYTHNAMFYNEALTVNYVGSNLQSTSAEIVPRVTNSFVLNKIAPRYMIPGKIEAENFAVMSGIQTETCSDTGGGLDVGYTNVGDYLKYTVFVQTEGTFNLTLRIAGFGGKISVYYDDASNHSLIGTGSFSTTGDWQNWQDFNLSIPLTAGSHTLKVNVDVEGFNFNYMNFVLNTSGFSTTSDDSGLVLYPNPVKDELNIAYKCTNKLATLNIISLDGRIVFSAKLSANSKASYKFRVGKLQKGVYLVKLSDGDKLMSRKLVVN